MYIIYRGCRLQEPLPVWVVGPLRHAPCIPTTAYPEYISPALLVITLGLRVSLSYLDACMCRGAEAGHAAAQRPWFGSTSQAAREDTVLRDIELRVPGP